MSKVNIVVNNKSFAIACDDGQETRVQQLGRYIDERYRELNTAGAAPNEAYMLVLTSLVIADEMFETRDRLDKARIEISQQQPQVQQYEGPSAEEIEAQVTASLQAAYETKIASLTEELHRARAAAQAASQQSQNQNNVADLNAVRADAEKAKQTFAIREKEMAQAVDALTDQLETVVKRLKRA